MNQSKIFQSCIILIMMNLCYSYYYNYDNNNYNNNGAYQFAYKTGLDNNYNNHHNNYNDEQNLNAQTFREESRDQYGNVHGKYGYVDPYGQLRIVKYRAGPDGYYAEGDIGVDQESLRQQRLLYQNDEATKIQQKHWQHQQPQQQNYGFYSTSTSSASSSASASASAASSSSFYGNNFNNDNQPTKPDWTTVESDNTNTINQQYNVKGGSYNNNYRKNNFYNERIVAAPLTTPVQKLNYLSNQYNQRYVLANDQYTLPVVRQYTTTTIHNVPNAIQPSKIIYNNQKSQYNYGEKIESPSSKQQQRHYYETIKSPIERYTEKTKQQQQIQPFKSLTSAYRSAASSAAASASASSSSSSFYSNNISSSTKGGYQQQQQSQRSLRYSNPSNRNKSYAQVNFKQYGPAAFQYSYSF